MLLFVIGGDTLSVASMVEVAYYIGCGRRLVLVLSDIPQPQDPGSCTTLEGMKVAEGMSLYSITHCIYTCRCTHVTVDLSSNIVL